MASDNEVNIIEITNADLANFQAEVEANVLAMQTLGYYLVGAQSIQLNDISVGVPKWMVILSYNKASGGGGGGPLAISSPLDEQGRLSLGLPKTAFGDVRVAVKKPMIQLDAAYGIDRAEVETFTDALPGTGSADTANSNFRCQTGVGVGGYGVIWSKQAVRYRPGEGSIFRFTALFDPNPVNLSLQAAGAFTASNGFLVGYNGSRFGVMHRSGGAHEIRTLTITNAATIGTESITITLDGASDTFNITNGSAAHNAYEIEQRFLTNNLGWQAYQVGSTVIFFKRGVGPANGAYSAVRNGLGTFAGTIAQNTVGQANTEEWRYQADADPALEFNIDKLDGSGPSGMVIDPSKGNVYEVSMQYPGYGDVFLSVENPVTGNIFVFHRWKFANKRVIPTLSNPTLRVGWIAASLGSTQNLTVQGASAKAGVEGEVADLHPPVGHSAIRAGVQGDLAAIFSIRVKSIVGGFVQLSDIIPRIAFLYPEGSRPAQVQILLNPEFQGETNWFSKGDHSIADIDESGGLIVANSGREIAAFIAGPGVATPLNFDDISLTSGNFRLLRGDVLTIAAAIDGGPGSDVNASMTWVED